MQRTYGDGRTGCTIRVKIPDNQYLLSKLNAAGKVVFGATVTLYDIETEAEITYQVVGDLEADIKERRIAITSPIARAMIGRLEGDEIVVKAPGGEMIYEIIRVEYL